MKTITRYLCVGLLALSSTLFASKSNSDKCCDPKGTTYRCYSENEGPLSPPGSGTFQLVDENGCNVGHTTAINGTTFKQEWVTKKGKMEIEIASGLSLFSATPIANAIAAFPELAPYVVTNPEAQVWVFVGDREKDNSNTFYWKGTGEFKKCNFIEVRCVFLTLFQNNQPYLAKCIGCHWTFNKKA